MNRILVAAGAPPADKRISPGLAYAAGAVAEAIHAVFRRAGEPRITRFVARQMTTAHWYDIGAARRDLGYSPAVSIDEGLERMRALVAGSTG